MKDIQPIPAKIYDIFENASPMFLVIGIRKEQMHPLQPPEYKNVSFHAGSIDELTHAINNEGLHRFTVFQINGTFSNEAQLRKDAEVSAREQKEAHERKMLAELKAKYESKMQVVSNEKE